MPLIAIIATIISFFWVNAIDKTIEYYKQNPNADPNSGWLDWDIKKETLKPKDK